MLATANGKLSACRLHGFKLQPFPQLRRSRRLIVKAGAMLSLQPRTSDTLSLVEASEPRPDSSQIPPSTPELSCASPAKIAREQHKGTDLSQASSKLNDSWGRQRLLPLLGAAVVLGVACAVLPLPSILACVLLVSAVALMEAFWKTLLPGHLASVVAAGGAQHISDAKRRTAVQKAVQAAKAPGLQALSKPPAEAAAWIQAAQEGLWHTLWQPLLDHREDWQEAMAVNGPYAWAYDASDISIGSLAPCFSGVQVFTCPSTGALVAVEVDVLLDSSTAPDSVHLQLLARGPIGKYGFHLESARVQGRMRLVPVPEHGELLVQYTQPPTVEVELSTAYPAMLPHNRAKLLQVDEIAEMLQDTLQGVLGSPDVFNLDYEPTFPNSLQYTVDGLIRFATARATYISSSISRWGAALNSPVPSKKEQPPWAPTPDSIHGSAPHSSGSLGVTPEPSQQHDIAAEIGSNSSSRVFSMPGVSPEPFSIPALATSNKTAAGNTTTISPRNNTVSQSAVLALSAQKAAWNQQQPHPAERTRSHPGIQHSMESDSTLVSASVSSSGDLGISTGGSSSSSMGVGGGDSSSQQGRWQLSSSYGEALECWSAAGITARLSATAAAAAQAAGTGSGAKGTAGTTATARAAAALNAHISTSTLMLNPVQDPDRGGVPHVRGSRGAEQQSSRLSGFSSTELSSYSVLAGTASDSGRGFISSTAGPNERGPVGASRGGMAAMVDGSSSSSSSSKMKQISTAQRRQTAAAAAALGALAVSARLPSSAASASGITMAPKECGLLGPFRNGMAATAGISSHSSSKISTISSTPQRRQTVAAATADGDHAVSAVLPSSAASVSGSIAALVLPATTSRRSLFAASVCVAGIGLSLLSRLHRY